MNASIDIGSNTILLLIGELQDGKIDVVEEVQAAPRLGQGVDADKNLSGEAMQRVIKVLKDYRLKIESCGLKSRQVEVVATSAVRDARNRPAFISRIKQETGFETRILSGKEEACYTYLGAQSVLDQKNKPTAVIDIGGGSTEVISGAGTDIYDRQSFDMGSVRFTERYLTTQPVGAAQLDRCRSAIADQFNKRVFNLPNGTTCVGVAGTVTSLASIQLGLDEYRPDALNDYRLSAEVVSSFVERFSTCKPKELLQRYPFALKGRADIMLAGVLILSNFLDFYDIKEVIVSTGGIRHGAMIVS